MNIHLKAGSCISCGLCAAVAPELFSIDSGVITLKKDPDTYSDTDKKLAREAAASCPNGVIEIQE